MLVFFFIYVQLFAQTFEYSSNCKNAYQGIYKLKINEGLQWIELEKKENPKNLLPYFIENHADFIKLFINDNRSLYESIKPKIETRLEKLKYIRNRW